MPKNNSEFMKNLTAFEKKFDLKFNNSDLLKQSMVHRSYLNENPSFELDHNERLEFLGDAVLELVVTEYLYNNYPNPEGELTNWRASLVNGGMLAQIARVIDLEKYLYLSKGEAKDENIKARNYILANAFEALVGAIYLDQGWDVVKKFITENLLPELEGILSSQSYLDPKSKFQELAQEKLKTTPFYQVVNESGPDHDKEFVIAVYTGEQKIAEGRGSSKQEAQVDAAKTALKKKKWN